MEAISLVSSALLFSLSLSLSLSLPLSALFHQPLTHQDSPPFVPPNLTPFVSSIPSSVSATLSPSARTAFFLGHD